jgi:hypothetical protein
MRRQQVIAIIVVLLLAGGAGAGYQFYFRPALEKFTQDKRFLSDLNTKLKSLETTFQGKKPEAAVQSVSEKIQPWHDTLEQRARQFSLRDFKKIEELPQTNVLKEYYSKTAQKMVDDLTLELYTKGIYFDPAIDFYFQMPRPATLSGKSLLKDEVEYWLSSIKLGTSITRLLAESEIIGIRNLQLWEPRDTPDNFTSYTVGVAMWMTLSQFCKFLDKLQSDETMCITVYGFRMLNSQLRGYEDPPLQIEVVFQIDQYKYSPPSPAQPGAVASAPGAPGGGPNAVGNNLINQVRERRTAITLAPTKEKSWWQKILPW